MANSVQVNFEEIRKALKTEKNKSVQDALKMVLKAGTIQENSATGMYILKPQVRLIIILKFFLEDLIF